MPRLPDRGRGFKKENRALQQIPAIDGRITGIEKRLEAVELFDGMHSREYQALRALEALTQELVAQDFIKQEAYHR